MHNLEEEHNIDLFVYLKQLECITGEVLLIFC